MYTASIHFSKQEVHTAIQKYTEAVHLDPTFSDAYEGKVTRVMRSALEIAIYLDTISLHFGF